MRPFLVLLALTVAPARTGAALALDLPVRTPGQPAVTGPAYRGDLVELRLAPGPTRAAAARLAGRLRTDALGVGAVDRLANRLGAVWFEPEFRGETPPPPGSSEPDFTAFYLAHLPAGVPLAEALEQFGALAEVVSADPIAILPVDALPNDSLWSASTWFYQPATRRDIHAPEAWDVTTGDTAVVVAVLDTGVLPYHPDLGGSVAGRPGQIWTNWREAGGVAGVDDDGNGYVDDLHGWDFVTGALLGFPGEDAQVEDNDPNDFIGHGTMVAGLVGALTNNGIGVAGTAWNVRLMPLRMGWSSTVYPGGVVQMDFAARAIRYATRMGASVINCSWASANSDGIDAAVGAAVRAGVTVVSAAGNNGSLHYLGDRDDVIAVAATDPADVIAPFSNTGAFVDLAAPGVDLRSTSLDSAGTDSVRRRRPAYAAFLSGTSFSSPLVAGVAALIQSRYTPPYATHPLTPRAIQLRLMETADDIAARNPGLTGQYGSGRLNAYRALTEASGSTAIRMRARSVGAQVLLPSSPNPRAALLTTSRRLLQIDGVTRDTVISRNSTGAPNGNLAAADLGGTIGTALFYATVADGVFAMAASNGPLPGRWPQAGSAPNAMNSPALGDLDGDGGIEVVSGGDDGRLWAWHADGSLANGYPVVTGSAPLRAGPALSDLDGVAGAEVVVAAADGIVHAIGLGGAALPGWPKFVASNPRAPVITRLGSNPSPTVLIAAGDQLHALAPDGLERPGFPVTLGGSASQDPALADLDADGYDEVLVITSSPALIEARDSSGVSLSGLNWPRPLALDAQGPPVVGELSSASPGPELLLYGDGSLLALERDGDPLPTFPKPGGAGEFPTLGQADSDGAVEVMAGSGSDSLFYIYDAGSLSSTAGPMPWPTARGNFARTGSRLYAPALGSGQGVAPAAITDLRVLAKTDTSVSLAWTATGEDGALGRPQLYAVRAALQALDEASYDTAPLRWTTPATVDAGGTESTVLRGLQPASRYWFALRAVDPEGIPSLLSNVVAFETDVGGPLGGRVGIALAVIEQPARGSVEFFWQAAADGVGGRQRIHLFDLTGRRLRVLEVGTAPGGRLTWDGRDAEGRSVPAGLYLARLLSGSFHTQTRVVLLP